MTDFKTAAKKVHGLGSAKTGVHHWVAQRFTAITNIALVFWLICVILQVSELGYGDAKAYMAGTWNAIFGLLFTVSTFYHAKLGLQTVIEDYIHCKCGKVGALVAMNVAVFLGMFAALFAILKNALA